MFFFNVLFTQLLAQRGYTPVVNAPVEGVEIKSKIVPKHFYNPKGQQCLVLAFHNTTESDKELHIQLTLQQSEGIMMTEEYSGEIIIPAKKKRKGKLNGFMVEPEMLSHRSETQIGIEFEINEIHK